MSETDEALDAYWNDKAESWLKFHGEMKSKHNTMKAEETKWYRKKSIEVEAVRFTDENKDRVFSWASYIQQNVSRSRDAEGKPTLIIPTLEGDMICSLGDYIIVEPFPTDWRKLYPCKPSIFEQTYELAQEGESS